MSDAGIILLFIILVPSISIICFRNWLIKLDQKYFYVLLVVALFCFIYFISVRYIPDAIRFNEFKDNPDKYWRDVYYSKLLLLDLCPFMAFTLPLIVIFDKKRRFARLLAPVTIIGSIVTLFGQCIFEQPNNLFAYIFVGDEYNRMYFMMHLLSLFLGLWVLMVSHAFTWKSCACSFASLAVWLVYTISVKYAFDVQWNVTGLSENDWVSIDGQYHKLYSFWPIPHPLIVIFWYTVAVIFNYFIILAVPVNFKQFKKFILNSLSFGPKTAD